MPGEMPHGKSNAGVCTGAGLALFVAISPTCRCVGTTRPLPNTLQTVAEASRGPWHRMRAGDGSGRVQHSARGWGTRRGGQETFACIGPGETGYLCMLRAASPRLATTGSLSVGLGDSQGQSKAGDFSARDLCGGASHG